MPKGISPRLPLTENSEDGKFLLNKTLNQAIAQNLKNLILTAPGERIMNPDFGVGLRNFLFRENTEGVYAEIRAKIIDQVGRFMAFVDVNQIKFISSSDDPINVPDNVIYVTIFYSIIPLGTDEVLNLVIE